MEPEQRRGASRAGNPETRSQNPQTASRPREVAPAGGAGGGEGDSSGEDAPGSSSAARWARKAAAGSGHASAGMQFALTIVLFGAGGYALDRWLGTTPWLLLLAVALGFGGGLLSLVRRIPLTKAPRRPPPSAD